MRDLETALTAILCRLLAIEMILAEVRDSLDADRVQAETLYAAHAEYRDEDPPF